jgi:subtilisin family serine protease
MTKASLTQFITALLALSVLSVVNSPAQERVVTVANEQLRFVAQAEAGYVVKLQDKPGGIGALSSLSSVDLARATPIRGLDRKGVYVVERRQPAGENRKTISALGSHSQVKYAAPLFSCEGQMLVVIPEIVARLKEGATQEDLAAVCESLGCRIKKRMEFTEQEYLLEVLGPDADAVFAAVERLSEISFVQWACPNTASRLRLAGKIRSSGDRVHAYDSAEGAAGASTTSGVFPNDEYFSMQWHLHNTGQSGGTPGADVRAPDAWEVTTGDPNIIVAVLDSGVDTNHPDLINNLVPGYDFYQNDDLPDPALVHWANAHGTACAGLVAAQGDNTMGVTGVAWNCKIMPIRIFRAESEEKDDFITEADRASAFRWAASHGADVLTNSWSSRSPRPIIHSAAVDIAEPGGIGRGGKGCIVLASSHNDDGPVLWPAKYPEVIAVGATDHNDLRWWYSNYGPELDLVAPSGGHSDEDLLANMGRDYLWTTDFSGVLGYSELHFVYGVYTEMLDYSAQGGTSSACPVAAGVAALILSVEPNLTGEEVRHFLEQAAKDLGALGWDQYYGWGRVDARAALDMVLAKRADLNGDWKVDWRDFAVLALSWRTSGPEGDIGPPPRPDGFVNVHDVILMGQYWMDEIPSTGLRAHWRLDETEGDVAYDCIGNHNAVVHEGEWTEGIIDGALQFNGLRTYMDCGNSDVLGPEQMTLEMWIEPAHMGGMRYIVSRTNESTDEIDYELMRHRDGELELLVGQLDADAVSVLSTTTTPLGEWSRVAICLGGSQASIYINDVLGGSANYGPRVARQGHRLVISSHQASTRFYNGKIDDVRIYDRAVTP